MFTGIVKELGSLSERRSDGELRIGVDVSVALADTLHAGDSVSVNGVCLTVTDREGGRLYFDVSAETAARTRLGDLDVGARLNIEPALLASDPVGGHFVAGHVDGVGKVTAIEATGRSHRIEIEAPDSLARYIAEKGSIAVDGVSLTVNEVNGHRFSFNVIPHTWVATNMQGYTVGTLVNLEADIIARYLARLVSDRDASFEESDITTDYLSRQGFAPPVSDEEEWEYEDWSEAGDQEERTEDLPDADRSSRFSGKDAGPVSGDGEPGRG